MDISAIRTNVKSTITEMYASRFPKDGSPPVTDPDYETKIVRLKRFMKNTNSFKQHNEAVFILSQKRKRIFEKIKLINEFHDTVKFISIRVVPNSDETAINEFGFAIFDLKTGTITSSYHFTDITEGFRKFHEIVGCDNGEQFIVGQNLYNNFRFAEKFGHRFPHRSIFDTDTINRHFKAGHCIKSSPKMIDLYPIYAPHLPVPTIVNAENYASAVAILLFNMLQPYISHKM